MHPSEITLMLQASIAPVILISGIGLILLSMTNRLGRTIDRARHISAELAAATGKAKELAHVQLEIIYRRSEDLRWAVFFAVLSIFAVVLLILTLFVINAAGVDLTWLVIVLFSASMVCLVVSLVFFLKDVSLALEALKLELGEKL